MHQFRNDYSEVASPKILEYLMSIALEQNMSYGDDIHSKKAAELILNKFGIENGEVFFMVGGTQVNTIGLSFLLKDYEGVIACDSGHINIHETGAVEGSGHKIFPCKNVDGKLKASDIESVMKVNCNCHYAKYKVVYISNATESGTIYTTKELLEIKEMCNKYGLYLFLDGARLGVALTSKYNDVELKTLGEVCDMFYLSGTKNGMLSGEALVFTNKELAKEYKYHLKNKCGLLAKGFTVSAQFERAFMEDDLFFNFAKNSNETANYLKEELKGVVEFANDSPTNQIFVKFNKEDADKIMEVSGAEFWEDAEDGKVVIRFVTSFNTSKANCDELINYIKAL